METIRTLIGPDNGDATALQLCARAAFLFAYGILCIRIAGRRTFSSLSPIDIVVAIVVGSNISRAMTGKAPFFPALAATLLLVVLHRLLAFASMRSKAVEAFLKGRAIPLVRNGKVDEAAMARGQISEDDLREGLRMEQIDQPEEAKLATLERGGKISAIPKSEE